jgi:hypothetical protein
MTRRITRRRFAQSAALGGAGLAAALVGHAQEPAGEAAGGDAVIPEAQAAIDRGLAYLARSQAADGSHDDNQGPNVAVAGLAGLALMAGGHQPGRGQHARAVSRAMDFLLARAAANTPAGYLHGGEALGHSGGMYQHGFGALFLAELYGMVPDPARQRRLRDVLEKAVGVILRSQNAAGGWRYTPYAGEADVSVTVAQLMALRAARNAGVFVPKSVVDAAVGYIKACQQPDGGFCYIKGQDAVGSSFPRSAAAVVGLFSAGIYDGEPIERGLKYLMQFVPGRRGGGFRDGRSERYYYYAQYYAALAMWTAGGSYWAEWFPAVRDDLLARSRSAPGGVWGDFGHGAAYATAFAVYPSGTGPGGSFGRVSRRYASISRPAAKMPTLIHCDSVSPRA